MHSLTVHLAWTFPPTPSMDADAARADELAATLFERGARAGVDITMLLEMCTAVRVPGAVRTKELRL